MTQTLIVALVVLAALAFVARRAWTTLRPKQTAGCGDGCGCGPAASGTRDWAER